MRITDWAAGLNIRDEEHYYVSDDDVEVRSSGLFFTNVPKHSAVFIYNRTTEETIELPDDGMVLVLMSSTAAEKIRDDLLDPSEFPEELDL